MATSTGQTALQMASDKPDILELLIDRGRWSAEQVENAFLVRTLKINFICEAFFEEFQLQEAILAGNSDCMDLLFEAAKKIAPVGGEGIDMNFKDPDNGSSLLHHAWSIPSLKYLLAKGVLNQADTGFMRMIDFATSQLSLKLGILASFL